MPAIIGRGLKQVADLLEDLRIMPRDPLNVACAADCNLPPKAIPTQLTLEFQQGPVESYQLPLVCRFQLISWEYFVAVECHLERCLCRVRAGCHDPLEEIPKRLASFQSGMQQSPRVHDR